MAGRRAGGCPHDGWGTGWGESGFFRIAYGECGIDATMWAAETVLRPSTRTAQLFRYWNSRAGDHFYTTNWNELRDGNYGWVLEGVQCYVYAQQQPGTVPLYRYWNPDAADHFYTTNWNELGQGRYGWKFEGVQCYVLPQQMSGSVPLYRYWNPGVADHFYTTNWNELGRGNYGWTLEGIQCYVLTSPAGAGEVAEEGGEVPETFRTSARPAAAPATFQPVTSASVPGPMTGGAAGETREQVPDSFRVNEDLAHQDEVVPATFSVLGQ